MHLEMFEKENTPSSKQTKVFKIRTEHYLVFWEDGDAILFISVQTSSSTGCERSTGKVHK